MLTLNEAMQRNCEPHWIPPSACVLSMLCLRGAVLGARAR
jgi:hypothetical protein